MGKMLIFSQSGNDSWFVDGISIGIRQPKNIAGDKLKELMDKKKMEVDELIKLVGPNFKDSIGRVLRNDEMPKTKLIDKFCDIFNVKNDYFLDKELQNVIITDTRVVVAEYKTEKRAMEVKKELDKIILDGFVNDKPIVINFPEE
jgi:hypothetical protein